MLLGTGWVVVRAGALASSALRGARGALVAPHAARAAPVAERAGPGLDRRAPGVEIGRVVLAVPAPANHLILFCQSMRVKFYGQSRSNFFKRSVHISAETVREEVCAIEVGAPAAWR